MYLQVILSDSIETGFVVHLAPYDLRWARDIPRFTVAS